MSQAHSVSIRVRYAETDQMGVVYYANYFVWFEVGRVELMRSLGFDYKRLENEEHCYLPVVGADCRYRSPARYDDLLTLETRILNLRTSVIRFGYRLLRQGPEGASVLLAEGETVHVVVDKTMQKIPMPAAIAGVLRTFAMTAGE